MNVRKEAGRSHHHRGPRKLDGLEAAQLLFAPASDDPPQYCEPMRRSGYHVVLDTALLDATLPALTGSALRVMLAIIRHTPEPDTWFAPAEIARLTAMDVREVMRSLGELMRPPLQYEVPSGGIVTKRGHGSDALYALNISFALLAPETAAGGGQRQ